MVAVADRVAPEDLSDPPTPSARLVARQLYATLVRADCTGRVLPGLALRWSHDTSGTEWTFELRRDLRFADGSPLDADAVRASWAARREGGIWPWPTILDVVVASPLTLRVVLDEPRPDLPAEFADPGLAVIGAAEASGIGAESAEFQWMGERTFAGGVVGQITWLAARERTSGPRVLAFEALRPGQDLRDALDIGAGASGWPRAADVLVTRDPVALNYARGRPDLGVVPLPWDRTYVLLALDATTAPSPEAVAELGRSLAGGAVRADSRAAEGPFWWKDTERCTAPGPSSGITSFPRIFYRADDPTARDLAERLLALAGNRDSTAWLSGLFAAADGAGQPRAVPLAAAVFDSALSTGTPGTFVFALPRRPPVRCDAPTRWRRGSLVLPLIDSRAHAILRNGILSLTVDGDGSVRFLPPSGTP